MKVVFISPDNARIEVDAPEGMTVMQAASANGVGGIPADCGGCASCATCHVYVQAPFADRLPAIGIHEEGMLDNTTSERLPNSRLSCQITITKDLDGITVKIPALQH